MITQSLRFILVYVVGAILLIVLVSVLFAQLTGASILMYGGIGMGPVILFLLAHGFGRYRRRRDVTVLSYIEQAVRLNLPLPRMLTAAQASEKGELAARLGHLSQEIEMGRPLSEAIAYTLPGLSPRSVSLVRVGEEAGCLAAQLERVVDQERREIRQERADTPLAVIYPVIVMLCLTIVLGGMATFIVPRFARIFEDFDLQLPAMTQWILNDAAVVGFPLMIIGAVGMLFICGRALAMIVNADFGAGTVIGGVRRLAWRLPIVHGVERNRGLADVFDVLADALAAGHTMPAALDQASKIDMNPVLRDRIAAWSTLVHGGTSLDDAARSAKMPAMVVGMLKTGQAAGNLPDVCRFLARYFAARFSRAAELIRNMVLPLIVVILAVLVGALVVSMFLPLVELISATSEAAL